MVCIACAILHGYIGIRFGHEHPLIAAFCWLVHIVAFVLYCGGFQRAYRIKEMQNQMKDQLVEACGRNHKQRIVAKEIRMRARALRCMGMQVGQFHEMERNSVLIFIGYVETQLVNLLVSS